MSNAKEDRLYGNVDLDYYDDSMHYPDDVNEDTQNDKTKPIAFTFTSAYPGQDAKIVRKNDVSINKEDIVVESLVALTTTKHYYCLSSPALYVQDRQNHEVNEMYEYLQDIEK